MPKVLSVILFLYLCIGCSPVHIPGKSDGDIINPPQKVVQSISYSELFIKVLEPKCIGCHGSAANINLETLSGARAALQKIERAVLQQRRMPKTPFTPLSTDELILVAAWVRAGGPDVPLNGDTAPAITPLVSTFSSIKDKILIPRCVACHRAGGEAPRVSLDTPSEMINSPLEIVVPGNPDESGIMLVVQAGARKKMPPEKSDIRPLTEPEISAIRQWIANGAKD